MIGTLTKRAGYFSKLTVKGVFAAGTVAAAVLLPLAVHAAFGAAGGACWLPMYLPVLLAGCILGMRWGVCIGALSPLVSFAVTSAAGEAMPAAARLPYMVAELCVFALVSGAFAGRIEKNAWAAVPAVLLAQICGRAAFVALAAATQGFMAVSLVAAWSQVKAGLLGLAVQAAAVPALTAAFRALLSQGGRRGVGG